VTISGYPFLVSFYKEPGAIRIEARDKTSGSMLKCLAGFAIRANESPNKVDEILDIIKGSIYIDTDEWGDSKLRCIY
jgi:hypothetical protein